jgi:hypothetical protein
MKENQPSPDDFLTVHMKMESNIFMEDREAYIARVRQAARGDPAKIARWLHGKWVKQPSGKGIFVNQFSRSIHVKGSMQRHRGIRPNTHFPIEIGYDLGTANSTISFEQVYGEKPWTVFDEIVIIGTPTALRTIARILLRKMDWWCGEMNHEFHFNHISDDSAFNQARNDGSYDYRIVEQTVAKELHESPERYPNLTIGGIRIVPAPKSAGSVAARVRAVQGRLEFKEMFVSALCPKHIEMFEFLEQDEERRGQYMAKLPFTPRKTAAGHIHVFDSMSYPIYHYEQGGRGSPRIPRGEVKAEMLDLNF